MKSQTNSSSRRLDRKRLCLLIFICALGSWGCSTRPVGPVPAGSLTKRGAGSLYASKARVAFKVPQHKEVQAELQVVEDRKQLFFVFEAQELRAGRYEVLVVDRCPEKREPLETQVRLMKFETIHGFVRTESSSQDYDLSPDSLQSVMNKKIALVQKKKDQLRMVDCRELSPLGTQHAAAD